MGVSQREDARNVPGVSRSGSTLSAGVWLNWDPARAAEYSFLLAIPAIPGAAVLQLTDFTPDAGALGTGPLLVGFASPLVSGIFAIRVLVRLLRRGRFHRFALHCLVLGLITLGWVVIG